MLSPNFAVLGAIINLAGCLSYAWDTLRGRTKPNRVGWSLWAFAPLVAFAAEMAGGVPIQQSLMTFSAGLGPALVLLASFVSRTAYWKIRPFDWACAGLSIAALILWWITGKGNIAILFSICADILACLPTATKAYTHPDTESPAAFVTGAIGAALTILTIAEWKFANYAFATYLLIANACIAGIILIRGGLKKRPTN
ncbi:MAG TPA: hypothetical protein VLF59_01955 [Candidatus Saccharimonadales bacterium]|nr:hypothetical protein [Candidatus Saccharimonadales bacterium]